MKNLFLLASILTFLLFITSCGNDKVIEDKTTEEEVTIEETFVDDANAEITAADTSSTGVYQEEVDETEETSLQDAMKGKSKPEVIEEGALSFCDCVKKNKELTDLMMETEDDAVMEKAMDDLKAMRTGECKIMFEGNQNTIEEKQAHERKVKRCL